MPPRTAEDWTRRLDLQPHPEGGFYRETYRETKNASTAIYFLLRGTDRSRLHRIASDELWHFHDGGPLRIVEISPDGRLSETVLGLDGAAVPQHTVPGGSWFGALPEPGTEFSLVSCTVAPGFTFETFELAKRETLLERYPKAARWIETLTDGGPAGP